MNYIGNPSPDKLNTALMNGIAGVVGLAIGMTIYNKSKGLLREATAIIRKYGVENQVDWEKVHTAIKKRNGIAVEISKAAPPTPVQIEGHIPAQADPHLPGGA